jgi:hypothetical protein
VYELVYLVEEKFWSIFAQKGGPLPKKKWKFLEQNTQKKNLAHKNNFINITVKSHILRHALKPGCLNLRTVPQLIGTLFFPLLRACHFIRKRGSCHMPLKAKILLFVA